MRTPVNNSIWYNIFVGLCDYLKSEKYSLIDDNYVVNKMLPSTSSDKIKNDGIYFFTDNLMLVSIIFDQNGEVFSFDIIKTLSVGDVFYYNDIKYFINSENKYVEYGKKYNNTHIGDYGITITIGNDDSEQLSFNTPELVLIFNGSSNINLLETNGAFNQNKSFSFNLAIVISESNLLNANKEEYSTYTDLKYYDDIIIRYLFNFFESNYCVNVEETARITEINYNNEVIEKRPVIMSLYDFTCYYI